MSQITRSWLAFAAMGAGVIHLGVASGVAIPAAVVLGALGFAEFAWGVGVLSRNRFLLPRTALVGALSPTLAWVLVLLGAVMFEHPEWASSFPAFPMAAATAFNLVLAASAGVTVRRAASVESDDVPVRKTTADRQAPAFLYLVGLMVGALAVSAVTTPALAATSAGANNPHANHSELNLPDEHQH